MAPSPTPIADRRVTPSAAPDLLDVRRRRRRPVAAQRARVDEIAVLHHQPGLLQQPVERGQRAVGTGVDVDEGAAGGRGAAVEVVDAGAAAVDADECVALQQREGHLRGQRRRTGGRRLGGAVADDEQRRAVARGVGEPHPQQPDPGPAQPGLGRVGLDGEQRAAGSEDAIGQGRHRRGERAGAVAELHRGKTRLRERQRHRSGGGRGCRDRWGGHVLPAHGDGRPLRRPDRAPGEQRGDAQQQARDRRPPQPPTWPRPPAVPTWPARPTWPAVRCPTSESCAFPPGESCVPARESCVCAREFCVSAREFCVSARESCVRVRGAPALPARLLPPRPRSRSLPSTLPGTW